MFTILMIISFLLPIITFLISLALKSAILALKVTLKSLELSLMTAMKAKEGDTKVQKLLTGRTNLQKRLKGEIKKPSKLERMENWSNSSASKDAKNVAKTSVKAGKVTVKAGVKTAKAGVKAAKATVKLGRKTVKLSIKALKLTIKAIKLTIKFIQFLIKLIQAIFALIEFLCVSGIIIVILIIAGVVAVIACLVVIMDNDSLSYTPTSSSTSNSKTKVTSVKWISTIEKVSEVYAQYSAKCKPPYQRGGSMKIKWNGKEETVRRDCSGFVGNCLNKYGVKVGEPPSGGYCSESNSVGKALTKAGFTHSKYNLSKCKKGTIIALDGHVEIYAWKKGGRHYVWNAGSDSSITSAEPTLMGTSHKFTDMWLPPQELSSAVSADVKEIINMSDKKVWKLISEGKYSSYDEANAAAKASSSKEAKFWGSKMKTIEVPVWRWKSSAHKKKVESKMRVSVNKYVADYWISFFTELHSLPEKYVVKSLAGYNFRKKNNDSSSSSYSSHSFGTAVDINPGSKGMGSVPARIGDGHPWNSDVGLSEPYKSEACAFNSNWYKLAKKYKLDWGGLWSSGSLDPMHFSIVGDNNKDTRTFKPKSSGQKPR